MRTRENVSDQLDAWLEGAQPRSLGCLIDLSGEKVGGQLASALTRIRWIERFSHHRLRLLFGHQFSGVVFGLLVLLLTLSAFLAPPFSGLDTLPSSGVVLLALGVPLEDFLMTAVGLVIGAIGTLLVFLLGRLVVQWIQRVF